MKNYCLPLFIVCFIIVNFSVSELPACIRCDLISQMIEDDVTPPEIIYRAPLYYPQELQDDSIMGTVILDVTVLPDSTIGYIEVTESVPELDSLAIVNVQQWEFEPAYRKEEPVIGVLTVEVDFFPDLPEEEIALPDTVTVDLDELHDKIDRIILKQQEPVKHTLGKMSQPFYSENYHLISWQYNNPYIQRDEFSVLPSYVLPHHLFQNYYPFYESSLTEHHWTFRSREYHLPVTFIEAYAGLGYLNMDYAHIDLAKNNALNIDDLQFRSTMFFQDGYWMGDYEKSSNFALQALYSSGRQSIRWNTLFLNQEIPPVKFRDQHEYLINVHYDEDLTEHSLYWENDYLNAGIRYEFSKFGRAEEDEQPERIYYQFLLNRAFRWRQHRVELNWEYFEVEETPYFSRPFITDKYNDIKRISYEYDGTELQLQSDIFSGMDFKYHAHSRVGYRFNESITGNIGFLDSSSRDGQHFVVRTVNKRDLYTNLQLDSSVGRINVGLGQREYVQYGDTYHYYGEFQPFEDDNDTTRRIEPQVELTSPYMVSDYQVQLKWGVMDWLFTGSVHGNLRSDLDYFPRWYGNANLECRYKLLHNNAITAGLIYRYTSDFYTPYEKITATNTLDGYLRISITKLFDIQADAKNLLEAEHVYGYPVAGIHVNAGIRWFFFN